MIFCSTQFVYSMQSQVHFADIFGNLGVPPLTPEKLLSQTLIY